MARAYSQDLRERVIAATEAGLPARHATDRFGIGIVTAIVWRAWRGKPENARRGGKVSRSAPSSTRMGRICKA